MPLDLFNVFHLDIDDVSAVSAVVPNASFQTKMEAALSHAASNTGTAIHIPADNSARIVSTQLPEITANNFAILGAGRATQIHSDAGGNLFRFGASGNSANRGAIGGFRFNVTDASPDPDDVAIDFANCSEIRVHGMQINDGCRLVSFDSTETCARNSIMAVTGNLNKGLLSTQGRIFLGEAGNVIVKFVSLSGNGVSSGSLIEIKPGAGDLDTADFAFVTMQSWVVSTDLDGAPIGLDVDWTNGNIQNVEFARCVVDHTSEWGMRFRSLSGTKNLTNFRVMNMRNDADEGRNLLFSHGGTGIVRGFKTNGSYMNVADSDSGLGAEASSLIESPGGEDLIAFRFDDNTILETTSATKPSALKIDANGVKARNNYVGRTNSGITSGWTNAIEVADTVTDIELTDNDGAEINGSTAILNGSYASPSNRRIIGRNTGPNGPELEPVPSIASAATTDLGSTASEFIVVTGAIGITSFGTTAPLNTIKTVRFASSLTLTHAAALTLPNSADWVVPAGHVVRFRRVSAGWQCLDERFEVLVNQTYSETPIVGGGSGTPSGITAVYHRYWKGQIVRYDFYIIYSTAGVANTSAQIPLPSGHPTVQHWDIGSGDIGTNKLHGASNMYVADGDTAATNLVNWRSWFERTAAGVWQAQTTGGPEDAVLIIGHVEYITSD